jgi:hypothetical protein
MSFVDRSSGAPVPASELGLRTLWVALFSASLPPTEEGEPMPEWVAWVTVTFGFASGPDVVVEHRANAFELPRPYWGIESGAFAAISVPPLATTVTLSWEGVSCTHDLLADLLAVVVAAANSGESVLAAFSEAAVELGDQALVINLSEMDIYGGYNGHDVVSLSAGESLVLTTPASWATVPIEKPLRAGAPAGQVFAAQTQLLLWRWYREADDALFISTPVTLSSATRYGWVFLGDDNDAELNAVFRFSLSASGGVPDALIWSTTSAHIAAPLADYFDGWSGSVGA